MLYVNYCNFRHNTDLFCFFVYVLKFVTTKRVVTCPQKYDISQFFISPPSHPPPLPLPLPPPGRSIISHLMSFHSFLDRIKIWASSHDRIRLFFGSTKPCLRKKSSTNNSSSSVILNDAIYSKEPLSRRIDRQSVDESLYESCLYSHCLDARYCLDSSSQIACVVAQNRYSTRSPTPCRRLWCWCPRIFDRRHLPSKLAWKMFTLYWRCCRRFHEEKQFVVNFETWTMNQNALWQLKSPQKKNS